ncbi:esterase-like activity of phytase family protein [Paracoccus sp. Z118]|uniref:esterase-like activity of phytase family protein n=1 Tax=Paracoccus sp. Z118 TaxID=2851017 RepID=UPI0020B7BF28|nr:esterase-like activity of phytase family protein [Paracoccus sp. Z118]
MSGPRLALTAALALGLAAACAGAVPVSSAAPPPLASSPAPAPLSVEHVGTFVWRVPEEDFGGFSGIEVSDDGSTYTVLSDRAMLRWGSIHRDRQGRIREMTAAGAARLRDQKGKPLPPGWIGDSEGMAIGPEGEIYVSFEGMVRVARYDTPDSPSTPIEGHPGFRKLSRNTALEALAILPGGALLTIPEARPAGAKEYPVWVRRDGEWTIPWTIPHLDGFAPVAADIGPDGRLYLLERDFKGLMGFASRVRRFDLGEGALGPGRILLTTRFRQYDNLEGLSVWDDGLGLRLTMISDDNFVFLQRTEIVEYRIREPAGEHYGAAGGNPS